MAGYFASLSDSPDTKRRPKDDKASDTAARQDAENRRQDAENRRQNAENRRLELEQRQQEVKANQAVEQKPSN